MNTMQTQQTPTQKPEKIEQNNINLGDKVKDGITGFEGIAVGCVEWISGLRRWIVQGSTLNKEGVPTDPTTFDEAYLKVTERNAVNYAPLTTNETGGRAAKAFARG